jgi:diacylglycerol kinase family enzyme
MRAAGITAELRVVAPERLCAATESAVASGAPVVAVAGGDGTMRTAAEALTGTAAALAPLPTGTLNRFALRLGIESLEAAVQQLHSTARLRVPVGIANDRLFLNTATFGLYGLVVRRRDRLRRLLTRWPAAAVAFAHAVARPHRIELEIATPVERLRRTTPLIWVRTAWTPDAAGAQLEVIIFSLAGARDTARFILRHGATLLRGKLPRDDRVEVICTRSLLVQATRRIDVTLDGESFQLPSPVLVAIEDDALEVVVDITSKDPDPLPPPLVRPAREEKR